MNLFDTLNNALPEDVVSKIAKIIDEDPTKTKKALDSINYTLVAGLIKRTGSEMGVTMLYNQLKKGNYNGNILSSLSENITKKPTFDTILKTGDGLLSQLFPAYKSPLTSMIGAHIGIKKASSSTLACISATTLIDALGKEVVEKNMDSDEMVNYIVDHHETLFTTAPDELMDKMIPSLGLQELQSNKFAASRKIPAQKTPKEIIKPVSSLDRPSEEVRELTSKPFPIKWLLIGLVAATLLGGAVYYYLNYYKAQSTKPAEEVTEITDSTSAIGDAVAVKLDSTKKDSTKIDSVKVATPSTKLSVFGEDLNTYLADETALAGQVKALTNVTFKADAPELTATSDATIAELAALMKKYSNAQIKIVGYANDGVTIKNPSLAVKRAFSVKQKLQALGVEETRIDMGLGGIQENKILIKVVKK